MAEACRIDGEDVRPGGVNGATDRGDREHGQGEGNQDGDDGERMAADAAVREGEQGEGGRQHPDIHHGCVHVGSAVDEDAVIVLRGGVAEEEGVDQRHPGTRAECEDLVVASRVAPEGVLHQESRIENHGCADQDACHDGERCVGGCQGEREAIGIRGKEPAGDQGDADQQPAVEEKLRVASQEHEPETDAGEQGVRRMAGGAEAFDHPERREQPQQNRGESAELPPDGDRPREHQGGDGDPGRET